MAIWNRTTPPPDGLDGIVGTLRFVRRQSDVAALREGDIALVDLPDLDAVRAGELVDARVRAVLNTSASSSGRVPNLGPGTIARAGIALVDVPETAWQQFKNGERVRLDEGRVFRGETLVLEGTRIDEERVRADLADAESQLATRLDSLVANASDHIQREHEVLLGGGRIPRVRTKLTGRPVVVVSATHDYRADLKGLRRYIADHDPVLIGAGAGADALLEAGYTPQVLVGALDNLSDRAIRASGEVVVATASGRVEMPERLEKHGKEVATFVSTGADDDLALLLADSHDAAVIVHVGAPRDLTALLDRSPTDVARMFVARLRTGSRMVDAKAVHHFATQRLAWWPVLLLLLAGVVAVGAAVAVTPVGADWFDALGDRLAELRTWIEGNVT